MTKNKKTPWLVIGAIGIVFGDIGTSPLYALQSVFHVSGLSLTVQDVRGIISLILWSITLIVTIKYVTLLMRVNNHGEGGIMALVGLVRQTHSRKKSILTFTIIGILGVSLFCGDGIITPAISVLSAVEGMTLVSPGAAPLVIPVALIVLAGLFFIQARGTGTLGKLFGPIMIVWFLTSALGGLSQIVQHPAVLVSLLPTTALSFMIEHPLSSFVAMGAVILAMTGAEALYADMGHFGGRPIKIAWLFVIFPALACTYLGQGALVSMHPDAITSAYYLLFPSWLHVPVIILATVATLIASQAVIAGVFSLTWQAVRLGFLPRLGIQHTSRLEFGQVYIPLLNWIMFVIVVAIILGFGSSRNLAAMYGLAVSGTLLVDTIFLLIIMRKLWHSSIIWLCAVAVTIMALELLFVSAGLSKLLYGAWVALLVALTIFAVMSTWYKGHEIIRRERQKEEGTLADFVAHLRRSKVQRIKGNAVYLGHHAGNAPMALHATLDQLHELHEHVVVVTVLTTNAAHIPEGSRITFDGLGHPDDGISHLTLKFGYKDIPNVPRALELARDISPEVDFNPYTATYFTSVTQPTIVRNHRMAAWRKHLYLFLDRNADNHSQYFRLPIDHTVEMRAFLEL